MDKDDTILPLPKDPSSYSMPEHAITTHFHFDWTIDFEKKAISGSVLLHLSIKDNAVNQLILDSSKLSLSKVICEDSGQSLKFEVAKVDPNFGSKITISLPSERSTKKLSIRIFYSTSPESSGLQWLSPNQTSGKNHPFLFSQCQPIHARSIFPCQDSPQVKATYSAAVKCDSKFRALMSALREEEEKDGSEQGTKIYRFRQPEAIPSYLLAVVVGDLASEEIGPRSRVWAEKEVLKAAAHEFAETEKMLSLAESLCGKYVWQKYDLLVLPPSFPYGGMENPCLTFVTPTLLAGDRSLSDVIAHEICHSWTGNLVTSCSWEHFWLNEGFTVFLERKVKAKMVGTPAQHMSAIEGWNSLRYCIEHRGSSDPLTALIPDLEGIDPDDAFCSVPYEKGHTFLWYLQSLVGGPDEFNPFLKRYLDRFHGRAIDSECFKSFFCSYFVSKAEALKDVDWHAWFYAPGMPPYTPKFDTSLVDSCYKLADSWKEWSGEGEPPFNKSDLEPFSSNQIIVLLEKLISGRLGLAKVQKVEETYALGEVTNAEIRFRWLRLCLQVKWEDKVEEALAFVNAQGRLKFVRPIYRDLYRWKETRSRAVSNFLSQKSAMMHVSVLGISKDLHLDEESS